MEDIKKALKEELDQITIRENEIIALLQKIEQEEKKQQRILQIESEIQTLSEELENLKSEV